MKKSHDVQNFMHHIELISKLRHPHVVSALGHCFECYWDDSSVSRIFLVFEYVPNGTLGSWLSGNLHLTSIPLFITKSCAPMLEDANIPKSLLFREADH